MTGKQFCGFYLTKETRQELRQVACDRQVSSSAIIREAVDRYLKACRRERRRDEGGRHE